MERRCISCQVPIDSEVCPYCGYPVHSQSEAHQLPVGTMLRNRYQVGRVLGQGGFGITYLGWDTLMETTVAIKEFYPSGVVNRRSEVSTHVECLTEKMAGHYAQSKERFLREAKALVRFRSIPEVVDLLDFVEENNTAYIVMEYVRGVDLARYIQNRGGRLSVDETFRILRPVMEALAAVHKGDIVHRDISPDNIILDPMGGAKLLDFGAVRTVEAPDLDRGLAKSTEAILKHGFAPIEQYNTRGSLGPWTDEYAMCATVWYCLTGRIPEEASIRVSEGVDPDWRSIEGLPEQQCAALEKGISVRAKDRFPNMDGLISALFGEPVPAYQTAPQPVYAPQPQQPVFARTEAINPSGYQPPVQPSGQYVPSSGQYMPPSGQYVPPSGQYAPPAQPQQPPAQSYAPPAKPVKEKKGKKWGVLAAIAAVLVVAILAGLLLPGMIGGSDNRIGDKSETRPMTGPAATTEPMLPAETTPTPYIPEDPLAGNYPVTILVPEDYGLDQLITRQVEAFEQANPGITISLTLEPMPTSDAVRAVLNGRNPDMFFFYSAEGLQQLARSGKLAPLDEAAQLQVREENDRASVAAATVDGALYAYPVTSDNGYFLYYDRSVISDQEAESLEAIINACEESGYYFRYEVTNSWYVPSFFFATGCRSQWTVDKNGSFTALEDTFNSSEGLIAARAMRKLTESSCLMADYGNGYRGVAAAVCGTWDLPSAQAAFGDNIGITDLPSFEVDGKSYHLSSFSGHKLLGVTPQADENRAQVLSLLARFLAGEESQQMYFAQLGLGWVPSNLAVQNSRAVQDDFAVAALIKQMEYAVPQNEIHGSWWDMSRQLGESVRNTTSDGQLKWVLEDYDAMLESLVP